MKRGYGFIRMHGSISEILQVKQLMNTTSGKREMGCMFLSLKEKPLLKDKSWKEEMVLESWKQKK
jgi:hypothetical protein